MYKSNKEKNKETAKKQTSNSTPLYRPKKNLNQLQLRLMKAHAEHHTKKHLAMMKKLMLDGFCFQQAHSKTMKAIGK